MPAIPKRESELARPRHRNGAAKATPAVTKGVSRPASVPNAPSDWHPIARRMWDSLKVSGGSDFFEQSDWAFAYSMCDDLSEYKKPKVDRDGNVYTKRSPEMLKAILAGLERLLVTEVDRRRVRIELHDPPEEKADAAVVAIQSYRAALEE